MSLAMESVGGGDNVMSSCNDSIPIMFAAFIIAAGGGPSLSICERYLQTMTLSVEKKRQEKKPESADTSSVLNPNQHFRLNGGSKQLASIQGETYQV